MDAAFAVCAEDTFDEEACMGLLENMADAVCNPENEDTYDEDACAEM